METQFRALKKVNADLATNSKYLEAINGSGDVDMQIALLKMANDADKVWSNGKVMDRNHPLCVLVRGLYNFVNFEEWVAKNNRKISSTMDELLQLAVGKTLFARLVYWDEPLLFGEVINDRGWQFKDGDSLGAYSSSMPSGGNIFAPATVLINPVKYGGEPIHVVANLSGPNGDPVEVSLELTSNKPIKVDGVYSDLLTVEASGGTEGDLVQFWAEPEIE